MSKLRPAHRLSLLFLIVCLLIVASIAVFINIPQPQTIDETVGESTVLFKTANRLIFSEADCYVVSWQVEGIEGVYLNDGGKIGQGEETICYAEEDMPELRVVFEDESEEIYRIDILVVQQQLEFWIATGLAGISLFFSLSFVTIPWLGLRLQNNKTTARVFGRVVLITLISIICVLLVFEIGLRFYFTNYGDETELISYIYSREDIQNQVVQFTGVPYAHYVPNPNYVGHNSLGYRGEETTIEKPAGTYRIVTIGESTTYGFGVNAGQAYPAVLQEELLEDYGYEYVEVINAGVIGYTSYEVLTNFQFRVLELDPDLIIYYGALNDADSRFEDPGCYNNPSPMYGLTPKLGLWRTDYNELPSSTLYRYFAINAGIMSIPTGIEFAIADIPVMETCLSGETYTDAELIELNQPHFAERNFRNLVAFAQFYDIDMMVSEFIFPTELEQVEGDENLIMKPERLQAVEEIDALYRQIADEMGLYYYTMGDDYVIEPGDFWTIVHMRSSGTEKQAKLYAKFIVENNIIPPQSELE